MLQENNLTQVQRNQLVEENQNLVWYYVNRICKTPDLREDAFQEGCLGLMRAAKYYDESRGNSFTTFASFEIQCSIRDFIFAQSSPIRIPDAERTAVNAYRTQVRDREAEGAAMSAAEEAELAKSLGVSDACFRTICRSSVSLDAPIGSEEGSILGDLVEDISGTGRTYETVEFEDTVGYLVKLMEDFYSKKKKLSETDRKILRDYTDNFIEHAITGSAETKKDTVLRFYPELVINPEDTNDVANDKYHRLDQIVCKLSSYYNDAFKAAKQTFAAHRAAGLI